MNTQMSTNYYINQSICLYIEKNKVLKQNSYLYGTWY